MERFDKFPERITTKQKGNLSKEETVLNGIVQIRVGPHRQTI